MKVIATRLGYYNHIRQKEGAVFELNSDKHFSPKWMEKASDGAAIKKAAKKPVVEEPSDNLQSSDEVI
jgi:hypothetical protein